MYTEEDLNNAIKQDIFNQSAVDNFRQFTATNKNTNRVDEENFKLISSFNDIFVVIACLLLLFSAGWWLNSIQEGSGYIAFPIIAWGLGEIFIRNKKMSLPAIVLLIAFIGGIFSLSTHFLSFSFTTADNLGNLTIAASLSTLGAYLHWLRFKVPITVAAGTVSLIGFLITLIFFNFPAAENYISPILLAFGVLTFIWAMFWDYADIDRVTHKSDIAFWLHLVSAPLIVHPVFKMLGLLDGNAGIGVLISVVVLYIFISLLSIAIDRRAFMVSSLAYVLYAISNILKTYGDISYNFALTGVLIGATLLLLSAYWHQTRKIILSLLPHSIKQYLAR